MSTIEDHVRSACEKFEQEGGDPIQKMASIGFDMDPASEKTIANWAMSHGAALLLAHVTDSVMNGEHPLGVREVHNMTTATLLTGIAIGIMAEQDRAGGDDAKEPKKVEVGLMNEFILKAAGAEGDAPEDREEFIAWLASMGIQWGEENVEEGGPRDIFAWSHDRAKEDLVELLTHAADHHGGRISVDDLVDHVADSIITAAIIGVNAVFMCARETV